MESISCHIMPLASETDTQTHTHTDFCTETILRNQACAGHRPAGAWFKKSHVTPVHKGGDTSDPSNFCPISVVPIVAKILEKLIVNQLCGYLESHQLFHEHQGAYRCGRSSEQILLYAVDTIINSLDGGKVVCAAFLDLRKAFDSLDHALLLQHLHHLGICSTEIRWFSM